MSQRGRICLCHSWIAVLLVACLLVAIPASAMSGPEYCADAGSAPVSRLTAFEPGSPAVFFDVRKRSEGGGLYLPEMAAPAGVPALRSPQVLLCGIPPHDAGVHTPVASLAIAIRAPPSHPAQQ